MKILISSVRFAPDIGGIETVSQILAEQFVRRGHEVIVVTQSPADKITRPYQVERGVSAWRMLQLAQWCDVYLQNNISLRLLWPALLHWRWIVIAHHTWIARNDGSTSLVDHLKKFIARRLPGIAISQAVNRQIGGRASVVGNPYDTLCFHVQADAIRRRDLVFLGRLVSQKGCDILLQALAGLKARGWNLRCTIVGSGPEDSTLKKIAQSLDLLPQVEFVGAKKENELVDLLNQHRIMAVPSVWNEPFGIVALEGIACGCVVVGTGGGGLPEAIGPCGLTFSNGSVPALEAAIQKILEEPELASRLMSHRLAHLEQFHPEKIAEKYLEVLEEVAKR